MQRISLRRIMTLSILAIGALPLVLFAVLFSPVLSAHLVWETAALSSSLLSSVAAAAATTLLDGPRRLLPTVLLLSEARTAALGPALRACALPNPEYSALLVLDRGGKILAAWPQDKGLEGQAYYPRAPVLLGQTTFSSPFLSSLTGKFVVEALHSNGERTAICLVDLASVSSVLIFLANSPKDRLGVIDSEGHYVLSSDPSRVERGETLQRDLLSAQPRIFLEAGSPFYASILPLKGSDWLAVYLRSRSEAEAPMVQFILRFALILLISSLTALGLALLVYRRISSPISLLLARISDMSEGHYAGRVVGDFSNEFRTIAEAFNGMADSIERRDRRIQESEERYRLLFHGNKVPALLVDAGTGLVGDANAAAMAYYGYPGGGLVGRAFSDFDVEGVGLDRLKGAAFSTLEFLRGHHRLGSGEVREVEIYVSPVDLEGRPRYHCVIFDVTRRDEAERRLRSALDEKTLLLREVYHRVKNNLQVISSLLNMQANLEEDAAVVAALEAGQERVTAMSLAHELVYQMSDLSSIDSAEYGLRLISYLAEAHGVDLARISTDFESRPLLLEVALPFGLAFNEMISNALKYGWSDGPGPALLVSLKALGPDQGLALTVEDRGRGLPAAGFLERTTSLGITLIRALASQLGGTVAWEAGAGGQGTRVVFAFKPGAKL